jgi:hypothetical protein
VTIVYHVGSNPDAHREVFPIQILAGNEKVRVRCIRSDTEGTQQFDIFSVDECHFSIMKFDHFQTHFWTETF